MRFYRNLYQQLLHSKSHLYSLVYKISWHHPERRYIRARQIWGMILEFTPHQAFDSPPRIRMLGPFLGVNMIGDTHSAWPSLITSIASIFSMSCFSNSRARVFGMTLNELIVGPTKLILFNDSPPWFDLNIFPTYVENLTALLNIWLDMQFNRLTPVPSCAKRVCPCRFAWQIVNAFLFDHPFFLLVFNVQCWWCSRYFDFRSVWGFLFSLIVSRYSYIHALCQYVIFPRIRPRLLGRVCRFRHIQCTLGR